MGRRSRQRTAASARPAKATPRVRAGAGDKGSAPRRERAFDRLPPARRVLAIYVLMAMFLAILTMVGIAALGGTLGPFVVLAYAILGAGGAYMWSAPRLRVLELTDEDRMLQTLAGGLLVISLLFAVVAAVLLTA